MGPSDSHSSVGIEYHTSRVVQPSVRYLQDKKLLAAGSPIEAINAYRLLRTQVLQRMDTGGWSMLGVISASADDGKSLTATNLAISIARDANHTALLVDLDLVQPTLHTLFGFEPEVGLSDYLRDDAIELGDLLVNPGIDGLVVLPGRESMQDASEVASAPRIGALFAELKARYANRVIVCDLPPVLGGDSVIAMSPFLDRLLFVVRDGKTRQPDIERALELVGESELLGTVLNGSDEQSDSYY
ncbi:MAG: CpsD/CapB family tyrosine-protein kinase [Gammaproteobacteria bacterium]|nr:CpsD/CapB family tyrosine-protein kinase [Gammaproteobacteria bacterium]